MKNQPQIPIPLTSGQILDMSFLENRARLLEIAAFLDRIGRAADAEAGKADFRYRAFIEGVRLLLENPDVGRTAAIQLNFSDPTVEPIDDASGLKAHGAWSGRADEGH